MGINKPLLNKDMGMLVPIITQIESKNGEVLLTINLNLNLKLDSEGVKESDSGVKFEKPDILDNSEIINFGKQV